jgi:hypothetical protein
MNPDNEYITRKNPDSELPATTTHFHLKKLGPFQGHNNSLVLIAILKPGYYRG